MPNKPGTQDIRVTPDGLTEFDPIKDTPGNRPTTTVRANPQVMRFGKVVTASANPRPKPEPEVPSLPRRDYTP